MPGETHSDPLGVLLEVKETLDVNVKDELVRGCYEIQTKYQFEKDRAIPIRKMRELVDSYIKETQ